MKLVFAEEMKKLDRLAVEKYAMPGIVLMENAAKAVADKAAALALAGGLSRIVVVCGKGNNGGDGFGAAKWLLNYGFKVKVLLAGCKAEDISGDALLQLQMYQQAGGSMECINTAEDCQLAEIICLKADLLIDAVLGTGFSGELQGTIKEVCRIINSSHKTVVAIDVPTGVHADNGFAADGAVKADCTVTMALVKTGLLLYPAKDYVGELVCANLGMPEKLVEECSSKKYLLTEEIVRNLLPLRKGNAHKGDAGRVTAAAGSPGYTGAAALAANAAVKAGAGLVSLLAPLSCRDILSIKLTEVMVHGLLERMPGILGGGAAADITAKANAGDVLAIGPGLGTAESTQEVIREVIKKAEVPMVIDADALTALKGHLEILQENAASKVITPHPGEMARLLDMEADEADKCRLEIAEKYAKEWNCIIVLKGAPTVIGCPDGSVYVNTTGCNAMATGGSGDVLTGIIAGLAAQNISLQEAALCGVYLHGLAGQLAAEGTVGLAAGEIAELLPAARQLTENTAEEEDCIYNYALNMIK